MKIEKMKEKLEERKKRLAAYRRLRNFLQDQLQRAHMLPEDKLVQIAVINWVTTQTVLIEMGIRNLEAKLRGQ